LERPEKAPRFLVEQNRHRHAQPLGERSDFARLEDRIAGVEPEDANDIVDAGGRIAEIGNAVLDVDRIRGFHAREAGRLLEPRARESLLRVEDVQRAAHHHEICAEESQRAGLAVEEAVEEAQLHEHDHHGEGHRRGRNEQCHFAVHDVSPGERRAARAAPNLPPDSSMVCIRKGPRVGGAQLAHGEERRASRT
jgi:hypothetical protein